MFTRTFEAESRLAGELEYLAEGHSGNTELVMLEGLKILVRQTIHDKIIAAAVKGDASLQTTEHRKLVVEVSSGQEIRSFQIFLWKGKGDRLQEFAKTAPTLKQWIKGGPARWPEVLKTKVATPSTP